MKLGQVLSFLDVGLVPEEYREQFQAKLAELRDAAPKVSFKDMRKVIEQEYDDKLANVFDEFDPDPIASASIGQVYKRAARRRARGRREGAVPRRRQRGPRRHAEHRDDPAPHELDRPRPRPEGDGRGDPRAHRGGARLRARGAEPARARAHLPRPPVHRRARRRHVALARAGRSSPSSSTGAASRSSSAAAGRARPHRRDHLPLLLRLHVPPPAVLRRPASGQLAAAGRRAHGVPGLRPVQAHPPRHRRVRAAEPAAGHRAARRGAHRAPAPRRLHPDPSKYTPEGSARSSSTTSRGGTPATRRSS